MNQQDDNSWGAQAAGDNVMGLDMQQEDFSSLLNLEDLGDFSTYNALDNNDTAVPQPFGQSLDLSSGPNEELDQSLPYFGGQSRPHPASSDSQHFGQSSLRQDQPGPFSSGQYGPKDIPRAQQPGGAFNNPMRGALPTPTSSEMYGKSAEFFYQQQQQGRHVHHGVPPSFPGGNIDMNTYTPFESPGLDGSQSAVSYAPEYAVPGSYTLSPLSSPAMNPQMKHGQVPRSHPRTAESSVVESPRSDKLDLDGEATGGQEERPRKTRKKATAVTRSATSGARTRKSAANQNSRKDTLSLRMPNRSQGDVGSLSAREPLETHGTASAAATPNSSITSSISPRPASEARMAPPPKPSGSSATPTQKPSKKQQSQDSAPNPATPASMMRKKPVPRLSDPKGNSEDAVESGEPSPATNVLESSMEYLRLPDAAAAASSPGSNNISRVESRSSATKQPTSAVDSATASESPRPSSTLNSPNGPVGMSKSEPKTGRGSKKRNSSGSNLVSPALRPKVSPSVKALLPEGSGMDSQTQALLIASRSNYENILSGNLPAGVSYPADLSTNLTSKRTSHKLAEQGRRNRINDALKEMQILLPAKFAAKTKDGEGSGSGSNNQSTSRSAPQAQSGNSKAATVENAIEYIKHLQTEMQKKDGVIQKLSEDKRRSK